MRHRAEHISINADMQTVWFPGQRILSHSAETVVSFKVTNAKLKYNKHRTLYVDWIENISRCVQDYIMFKF
jgi:hypothetical protein